MKLRLSAAAEADLEAIGDWIARDNPGQAVSFIMELREAAQRILEMPHAYPLVPRYEVQGVRPKVHGSYLIFYVANNEAITVIHILHGARGYDEILFGTDI